jgi:hypothetical protein
MQSGETALKGLAEKKVKEFFQILPLNHTK